MTKRFVEIADYTRLQAIGFSKREAAELVLDAARGEPFAVTQINLARDAEQDNFEAGNAAWASSFLA